MSVMFALALLLGAPASSPTTLEATQLSPRGLEAAFFDAVRRDDLPRASALLNLGQDPNAKDATGYTALMIAAGRGDYQMCDLLLSAGADVHILDNRMGASALHKAAQGGVVPVARLLLKHGAFIDLQAPTHGHTPLHDASWHRNPAMVAFLLEQGANWEILASDQTTAKDWAIWAKDQAIVDLFEAYEAKRAAYAEAHPLFMAVVDGDLPEVKALIAAGVDVNHKARFRLHRKVAQGTTPLLMASLAGQVEIVEALLAAGARARIVDWLMKSTVVHKAGYLGRAAVLPKVLAAGGEIDAQGPYNGYTALHDAAWHGHLEAAKALVEAGARLDLEGHDGNTPRDLAEKYGYVELLKFLDSCTK